MTNHNDKLARFILIDVISLSKKQCRSPIQGKLAYAGCENFLGRIVDGYSADADDICLLSKKAALSLCNVQNELNQSDLGLYILMLIVHYVQSKILLIGTMRLLQANMRENGNRSLSSSLLQIHLH